MTSPLAHLARGAPRIRPDALCAGTSASIFCKHENTPIAARSGSVRVGRVERSKTRPTDRGNGEFNITARAARVGKPASAARVARAGAKLLEPIFQRKRRLRLLLGILADRMGLAARVSAPPAAPREIAEIGRAYALACRRCWWTFGEWLIGRGHPSG